MTADTDEFKPGDRATWMRVQRGGYGYVVPVPCTIEQLPHDQGRRRKGAGPKGFAGRRSNQAAQRAAKRCQMGKAQEAWHRVAGKTD